MLDREIEVLDSAIRFTDLSRAASVLGALRGPDVPLEIKLRGRLAANLWRFGWSLERQHPEDDVFQLRYTCNSDAPFELIFEALRTVASLVEEGSFILLRNGAAIQHARFHKRRVDFELGRLAFVPDDGRGRLFGHVVVALYDNDLSPVHAGRLARGLLLPVMDTGIETFRIRAELVTRGRRYVGTSGRIERPR